MSVAPGGDPWAADKVRATPDLVRIRDMPRRIWQEDPQLPALQARLTQVLRYNSTVCGTPCMGCEAKVLNDWQAAFLKELYELGGGILGPARAGKGKTLASLLAATITKAARPVLVVPGGSLKSTQREASQYARHWRIPPITIVSYQWISNPKNVGWLEKHAPDLLLLDEIHMLRDSGTITCKRIRKYLKAFGDHCRVVGLSASMVNRSIREHWHYTRWALRSRAPVPSDPMEAKVWQQAMDEKMPEEARAQPGALLTLAEVPIEEGLSDLQRARRAYGMRFTHSPGVVATADDVPPYGLHIEVNDNLPCPPEAAEAMGSIRDKWQTPDGVDFSSALEKWRHSLCVGSGFYQKWDPAAPAEWLELRAAWAQGAREFLKYSHRIDSESILKQEVREGQHPHLVAALAGWEAVQAQFVPNPVAHWVHDAAITYATQWLQAHPKGLVWTPHVPVGERLSEMSGVPYFRAKGLSPKGQLIDDYYGGPAIVSVGSCHKSRNLQRQFCANLLLTPPPTGEMNEQLIARTHRDGQREDDVIVEYLLTTRETHGTLAQAIRDSDASKEKSRQSKKLSYGNGDYRRVLGVLDSPEEYLSGW